MTTLRTSHISTVRRITTSHGETIEERVHPDVPARYADLLVEWARRVASWQKGHERILAVDTTARTVWFAPLRVVSGSALAEAFARIDCPFPLEAWLALARAWSRAVDEQLVRGTMAGVRGQWVVDADQLGIHVGGGLAFGHARIHSVMDGLRLDAGSEHDPLPLVRHPLQWGTVPRDVGPAAQVKDLAFSLALVLTGRMPFDGADDVARAAAIGRGDTGLGGLVPDAIERELRRAMDIRPDRRHSDVAALVTALETAAGVVPLTGDELRAVLAAVVADGDPGERRERVAAVCRREPPAPKRARRKPAVVDPRGVDVIVAALRSGVPRETAREAASDHAGLEQDSERVLDRWMSAAVTRFEAELAAGRGRDTEALERALATLNRSGVVARLGYGVSRGDGVDTFRDDLADLDEAGLRVRGLVFCSYQGLASAIDDDDLWLDAVPVSGQDAEALLDEVCAALRAEGLAPRRADRSIRLEGFALWRRTGRAECIRGMPRFATVATQRALGTPEGVVGLRPAPVLPPAHVPSVVPPKVPTWVAGGAVQHAKFGVGTIVSVQGDDDQAKLTIRFADGDRTLLARFVTRVARG